ncbi:MAG: hypothetical protein JNK58_09030 [Phycisphaerae bacterium]|nr:hypothetical protein [Phycisphaerae bacterium]
MTDLLSRLLDLDTLRLGAAGVDIGFQRPIPAWAWIGLFGAAVLVSFWSYSRLTGSAWVRAVLASLRAALLLLLVLLISGPQLVQRDESVERDWVLVLVDRSASMTIADAPAGEATGARVTRESQVRRALESNRAMWSSLAKDRVVQWLGFDGGAFDLTLGNEGDGAGFESGLGEPTGRRTSIGAALDQALARAAARPLAGVVIFSDGRSMTEPTRAAVRRLQADRVPVHVMPLGSDVPIADLALRRADAPRVAFVNDSTPVRVELERLGSGAGSAGASGLVRLVDKATGLTLDERRVSFEGSTQTVTLTTRPDQTGVRTWSVELIPDGPDLVAGNNQAEFSVELVDRPMRVLYVDGYPRWEQRFLRNLLIREKSVTCSTLILAPERRYMQEGDIEIDSIPDSPERWAEYDAVILGDVSPDVFSDEQLVQLREHIARRGGGLLWIGGAASTPMSWFDSPLADLLPFTKGATDGGPIGEPVRLRPTPTAERLGLLQLGESADEPWPAVLSDESAGWSSLRWAQRISRDGLKPTAETLATADVEGLPLVLSMRYGAGRSLYVATDEIWRWRYARGETLPERFWLQMIRLLGRESLARSGRSALIEVTPRRADVDQPVRVAVELLDQLLVEQRLASVQVRLVKRGGEGSSATTTELTLRPEREDGRVFSTVWLASEAGTWTAEPIEPVLANLQLSAELIVTVPDDELRSPETNHGLLRALAAETEGSVLQASDLATLPDRIPNRKIRLLNERTETLWDTPLALILFLSLATLEWVGRRVIRLL